jgi:hypothetical protein
LKDLEFFGVGTVEGQEVEEVVCYDLSGSHRVSVSVSASVSKRAQFLGRMLAYLGLGFTWVQQKGKA